MLVQILLQQGIDVNYSKHDECKDKCNYAANQM